MGTGKENFNSAFGYLPHVLLVAYYTFNLDTCERVLCLVESLTSSSQCLVTSEFYEVFKRELNAYIAVKVLSNIFLTELYQGVSQDFLERLVCLCEKVNVIKMNCGFSIVCRIFNALAEFF